MDQELALAQGDTTKHHATHQMDRLEVAACDKFHKLPHAPLDTSEVEAELLWSWEGLVQGDTTKSREHLAGKLVKERLWQVGWSCHLPAGRLEVRDSRMSTQLATKQHRLQDN